MTPDDTVNQLQMENDRLKRLLQQQKTTRRKATQKIRRIGQNSNRAHRTSQNQWEMNHFLTVLQTYGQ